MAFSPVDTLRAAEVMMTSADPQSVRLANEYLLALQNSPLAWEICKSLLHSPARLVAAQILYEKTKRELSCLSESDRNALREFVLEKAMDGFDVCTMRKLCQCYVLISLVNDENGKFVCEAIAIQSEIVRLEVLNCFPQLFTELPFSESAERHTRIAIEQYGERLLDILSDALSGSFQSAAIEVAREWGEMQLPVLTHSRFSAGLLPCETGSLLQAESEDTVSAVCDVWIDALKYAESMNAAAQTTATQLLLRLSDCNSRLAWIQSETLRMKLVQLSAELVVGFPGLMLSVRNRQGSTNCVTFWNCLSHVFDVPSLPLLRSLSEVWPDLKSSILSSVQVWEDMDWLLSIVQSHSVALATHSRFLSLPHYFQGIHSDEVSTAQFRIAAQEALNCCFVIHIAAGKTYEFLQLFAGLLRQQSEFDLELFVFAMRAFAPSLIAPRHALYLRNVTIKQCLDCVLALPSHPMITKATLLLISDLLPAASIADCELSPVFEFILRKGITEGVSHPKFIIVNSALVCLQTLIRKRRPALTPSLLSELLTISQAVLPQLRNEELERMLDVVLTVADGPQMIETLLQGTIFRKYDSVHATNAYIRSFAIFTALLRAINSSNLATVWSALRPFTLVATEIAQSCFLSTGNFDQQIATFCKCLFVALQTNAQECFEPLFDAMATYEKLRNIHILEALSTGLAILGGIPQCKMWLQRRFPSLFSALIEVIRTAEDSDVASYAFDIVQRSVWSVAALSADANMLAGVFQAMEATFCRLNSRNSHNSLIDLLISLFETEDSAPFLRNEVPRFVSFLLTRLNMINNFVFSKFCTLLTAITLRFPSEFTAGVTFALADNPLAGLSAQTKERIASFFSPFPSNSPQIAKKFLQTLSQVLSGRIPEPLLLDCVGF